MKKLLAMLGVANFIVVSVGSVISCKNAWNNNHHNNENEIDYNGDLKILNDITKAASNAIQKYTAEKTLIDTNFYPNIDFENLFSMVRNDHQKEVLKEEDGKVAPVLATLKTGFMAVFDNINREIANKYSNYYPNSFPLNIEPDSVNFILNFIDVEKLGKLAYINLEGLKAVRLDFKFYVNIKFKKLETVVPFLIQYTITNDIDKMQKILKAVVEQISNSIIKFFNEKMSGDIIVDKHEAFKSIYDNFDLNYAYNHSMLDAIVQRKLEEGLKKDDTLGELGENITYASDEKILILLNSIINPDTNGVTPVLPYDEKYAWVNTGYAPDKLTPENFLEFYGEKLNILTASTGEKLQLGQFKINLAKILVAGLPLSGIAVNDNKPIYINVGITRAGMIKKIENFGRIIAAFYKYFQITWDICVHTEGVIFLPIKKWKTLNNQFAKNPALSLQTIWNDYLREFKEQPEIKILPDIGKFWVTAHNKFNVDIGKDRAFTWHYRWYDELKFRFGINQTTNNIYYTPWPIDKYRISFKPEDYVYPPS
ncbi:hypothetical protein [Spiroplasma endosymbiont of Ammophila pubescens]|uniref:hypothetical protein n=1 Tax=Spiroplasma endosymbiont of Ammophila pubescens TaxID=3066315 RepID=UPI0032B1B772